MKLIYTVILLLAASIICAQEIPRVFSIDGPTLVKTRKKISQKDETIYPAYQKLIRDAEKALKEGPFSVMEKKHLPPSGDKHDYMSLAPYHWPDSTKKDGIPYIRKDGQTNPEVKEYKDKEYMPRMAELVHTLSLAYYFSGQEVYAQHAAKLLQTWFLQPETRMNPNLNFAQAIKGVNEGRGAGLIDSRHFIKIIDAIGLLKKSKHWKEKEQVGMQLWFRSFLEWMHTSKNGLSEMKAENNHGTWYDAQRLAMALFIDSSSMAKEIIIRVIQRLDVQMDDEGKFPKEMERTIALHYNLFNLEAFFHIAFMAETMKIDLWNLATPSGKTLKKGFDFLYPYLSGKKEWTGQQIKSFDHEEGFAVLLTAASKYNCKDCRENVRQLAGEKAAKLKVWLVY